MGFLRAVFVAGGTFTFGGGAGFFLLPAFAKLSCNTATRSITLVGDLGASGFPVSGSFFADRPEERLIELTDEGETGESPGLTS